MCGKIRQKEFAKCGKIRYAYAMTEKAFVFRKFAEKRDEWMRRMIAVPNEELSSGAKIVAIRLALYMNEEKQRAFPSYAELAQKCGMSPAMVQRHTKILEEKNWIEVIRKRNFGNTYWLRFAWIPE